ncbi:MAG TPA: hypothetical protein VIV60_04715 [Polyangiaceae bacterium]
MNRKVRFWSNPVVRSLVLCSVLSACDAENAGSTPTNANCPDFARIVTGSFSRSGDTLNWTLEVEDIPAQFVVNQADVPDNAQEYAWDVLIDSDNDGQDDLEVSVVHFKPPGSMPKVSSDALDFTQKSVWRLQPGQGGVLIESFEAHLDGNEFTFNFDASADTELASVQSAEQCTWKTFFRFGSELQDTCRDEWRPGGDN